MRLTTLVLVLILALAATAVFANGVRPVTPPAEQEVTPPTTPEGAGPMPTMPTTPPVVPSTCPTTLCPATAVCPPQPTTDVEVFNTNQVLSTFPCADAQSVTGLRQAGWAWGDIYILANIATRSNRPILEIASLRSQGMAYDQIACRYNLAAADILCPMPCPQVQTRVAGFTGQYGYQPLYYRTDPWGNPACTRFDAERLMRMGYAWDAIASAANVSAVTGVRCDDILAWVDRGYTWTQIANMYGVPCDRVLAVTQYPFARNSGFGSCPTGAGPCPDPCAQPCPDPCAQPCPPANPCGPVMTTPTCPPANPCPPTGAGPCPPANPCDTCPRCPTTDGPCDICPPTAPCNCVPQG